MIKPFKYQRKGFCMKTATKNLYQSAGITALVLSPFAFGQAVIPADRYDLVNEIDAVDGGGSDGSFVAQDVLRLGLSMSISGDTIVLGNLLRSNDDSGNFDRGRVITLRRDPFSSSGWIVASTFNHNDTTGSSANPQSVDDEFGYEVVVDGNLLFVSSRRFDEYDYSTSPPTHVTADTGVVFVYTRPNVNSDEWSLFQTIYDPDPFDGERFGHAVVYENGTLVVGAQRAYKGDLRPEYHCGVVGEIHIYEDSGSGGTFQLVDSIDWSEIGSVNQGSEGPQCFIAGSVPPVPDDAQGKGYGFAKSVAIEGDWIIASADWQNAVAVFNRDSSSTWSFHSFLNSNQITTGLYGTSLSMSQGRIAIGTKKFVNSANGGTKQDGAVSLFVYDINQDAWVNTDNVTMDEVSNLDTHGGYLGRSVKLDGDLLVVSAENQGSRDTFAEIFYFVIDPSNDTLVPSGRVYYNGFGNGQRAQQDKLGMVVDGEAIITGDIAAVNQSTNWNQLRIFRSCVADMDANGILDQDDSTVFTTLFQNQDPQADFAMPFGVFNIFDVFSFIKLYNLGCP
jgi:hypothetical protein